MSRTFTNQEVFGNRIPRQSRHIHEAGTSEGVRKAWRTRKGTSGQTQSMRDGVARQVRAKRTQLKAGYKAGKTLLWQGGGPVGPNTATRLLIKAKINSAKRSQRNWKSNAYASLGMKKVRGNMGGTYYE